MWIRQRAKHLRPSLTYIQAFALAETHPSGSDSQAWEKCHAVTRRHKKGTSTWVTIQPRGDSDLFDANWGVTERIIRGGMGHHCETAKGVVAKDQGDRGDQQRSAAFLGALP